MSIRTAAIASSLAAALALTSCGSTPQADEVFEPQQDVDYTVSVMRQQAESTEAVWLQRTYAEVLPSQRWVVNGRDLEPVEGLAIGTVEEVLQGAAFVNGTDDPRSTRVKFDDPEANWRTVEVIMSVDQSWGIQSPTVTFALVVDGNADADKFMRGIETMHRLAVALDPPGRFHYNPEMLSVSRDSQMFGVVEASGKVSLPAMGEEAAAFMAGLDTVEEIAEQSRREPPVIRVDWTNGEPVRK